MKKAAFIVIVITKVLLAGETVNTFYHGRVDKSELSEAEDDYDFRRKIHNMDAYFGGAGSFMLLDYPAFIEGRFLPEDEALAVPFSGFRVFAGLKLLPGLFEELEVSSFFYSTEDSAIHSNSSGYTDKYIFSRKGFTINLSYLIKAKLFHVYKARNNDKRHYNQYWVGIGPSIQWLSENPFETADDTLHYELSGSVSTSTQSAESFLSFRAGAEAVAGVAFSFAQSHLAYGLQVRYGRYFARHRDEPIFVEAVAKQSSSFSVSLIVMYNYWEID